VTLRQSPKVLFTTLPGICNDTTARQIKEAKETGGVSGTFAYFGTGVSATGLVTPKLMLPNTYPLKYIYTTALGCSDSATQNLTVWPSPVAKWNVVAPTCEKNQLLFTDSSVANFSKITNWFWNFGDGTTSTKTNGSVFTKQYASANNYTASLRVVTDSGCRSSYNSQTVNVHALPVLKFGLPSICLPDGRGLFTDSSTIADQSEALFGYQWNFGDPNDATSSLLKNPVHKYSAMGPYTVQLKITSKDGCVDSLQQSLTTIYPQPKANFTIQPNEVCMGDTIHFVDVSAGYTGSIQSRSWDLAQGNTSALQNPYRQFSDSGTFNISLYIVDAKGCLSDTAVKPVIIDPYPHLTMPGKQVVLEGGSVQLKPIWYAKKPVYNWAPALYLDSSSIAYPVSSPLQDITYQLTLTGKGNCSVSGTVFVKVLLGPVVPNVFSPNGDGINDTWVIQYLDSYPGCEIEIFSRSGQSVFKSVGYTTPWDGMFNGKPLPIGTYYYLINPKNGRALMSGSVTIIK
jgi:gliding motility-associated-like protein